MSALDELCRLHESNASKYTFEFIRGTFEELWWAWIEELKDQLRKVKKLLNKDRPRKDDLKLAALAPGPDGETFCTFQTPGT